MQKLDADAVRATQRLIARGFEAYLVGGCVRDLLLGRTPKDYDIATEARPPQVKRTFPRNCRIIGRRFKLAHLHFHDNTKILEVSTFRRTPQIENPEEDLLITRDNEFGTAEEDALRRDFTVNALFLDPTRDTILDYTNGLEDLQARVIRTIGDPRVRFREDPVRILRAAKFAGRLGFSIEPETFAAMAEASGDLVRAAPPRLLEEILRLLRGGHALESFQLLRDVGALHSLVPVLADFLQQARHDQRVEFWRLLDALDRRIHDGAVLNNGILLGTLLVCPVLARAEADPGRSPSSIAEDLLGPLSQSLRLPRRDAGCLKRICGVQHRFTQTDEAKRFRVAGFVQGPYFEEALELFELRMEALQASEGAVEHWRRLADRGARHAPADFDHDSRPPVQDEEHMGEDAGAVAADDGEEAAPGWPGAPAATGAPGPRRRRRRRRGRRGGRGAPMPEAPHRGGPQRGQAGGFHGDEDVLSVGFDFAHPEGPGQEPVDDHPADGHAAAEDTAGAEGFDAPQRGDEPGTIEEDRGADMPPEGPGRRRRRRRRRGRHRDDAGRFPASDEPAPHGEGIDREAQPRHPLTDAEEPLDEGAERLEPADHVEAQGPTPAAAGAEIEDHGGRRRRRRRGRRGRGGGGGPPPGGGGRPNGPRPQQHDERRQPHRRGHGGPRDVDVVPRHRDRRGKIHVIEPAPLDLSAFDVELDPKRVPTFGSIVEGKGRPKKRSPRVPDDGVDDYRPPPPPGGDSGPSAPPPPPPAEAPDTFGDW